MKEILDLIDKEKSPANLKYIIEYTEARLDFVSQLHVANETNDQVHCTGAIHQAHPVLEREVKDGLDDVIAPPGESILINDQVQYVDHVKK